MRSFSVWKMRKSHENLQPGWQVEEPPPHLAECKKKSREPNTSGSNTLSLVALQHFSHSLLSKKRSKAAKTNQKLMTCIIIFFSSVYPIDRWLFAIGRWVRSKRFSSFKSINQFFNDERRRSKIKAPTKQRLSKKGFQTYFDFF